jgi:type I restriction enzyme S subunit
MRKWETTKLGEALRLDLDRVPVDAATSYPMVGVLSFGRGLFEREPVEHGKTSYRQFYRLKAEHVVMSQLFGWEGALALSEKKFAGRFLSPQFPTFLCDTEKLDRSFLGWLMKRPAFWEDLGSRASGMGDRRRTLTPDALFRCKIPLPPLAEQRQVVARIEELAAQIHEARTLRHQAAEEAEAMLLSQAGIVFSRLADKHEPREFGSFSPHVTSGPRNWAKHYEQNGARFYRAQDIGPDGEVLGDTKVFITPPPGEQGRTAMLQHGDLMLVITGATVGRANVYRKGLEPGFVSQHVGICRLPQTEVEPEFVLWGLRGPTGQAQLLGQRYGQGKPGLNLTNIRSLSLPFPPLAEQRRVVAELDALQAEVVALKRLQAETGQELNALLPAILDRAFKGEL